MRMRGLGRDEDKNLRAPKAHHRSVQAWKAVADMPITKWFWPMRGVSIVLAAVVLLATSAARADNDRPYYHLAFDGDEGLCPEITSMYNKSLYNALLADKKNSTRLNALPTNFAYTEQSRFVQIGLIPPPLLKTIAPVRFYSAILNLGQQSRVIAEQDFYRGNSTLIALALLRTDAPLAVASDLDSLGGPQVPRENVDREISVGALSEAQRGGLVHLNDAYFLTKWPGFSRLISKYGQISDFVPFISGSVPVTITPFQGREGHFYLIYDQYISMRMVRSLTRSSGYTAITVVQLLTPRNLEDICYLVLAPSELATTVETNNVR
jgi:hypothetical protein